MAIPPVAASFERDYLRVNPNDNPCRRQDEELMIYIFHKNNSVQIAWGSKAPKRRTETRLEELDLRMDPVRLIRSFIAG